MRESNIQQLIRMAVSKAGARVFWNNVGKCWIGKAQVIKSPMSVNVDHGDVVIRGARRFHAGLAEGSSDLIGWDSVTVTPDMVGRKIAVFVSMEVKTPKGRATPKQEQWIKVVDQAGGIAGIVRHVLPDGRIRRGGT